MVKYIVMVKRKAGLTVEGFSKYWEEIHGPLAVKHNRLMRRYVQNHPVKLRGEPPVDGVVEIWFDDMEAVRAWADFYFSDEGKVIRDDEERFIDRSTMVTFVAEEKVIKK